MSSGSVANEGGGGGPPDYPAGVTFLLALVLAFVMANGIFGFGWVASGHELGPPELLAGLAANTVAAGILAMFHGERIYNKARRAPSKLFFFARVFREAFQLVAISSAILFAGFAVFVITYAAADRLFSKAGTAQHSACKNALPCTGGAADATGKPPLPKSGPIGTPVILIVGHPTTWRDAAIAL